MPVTLDLSTDFETVADNLETVTYTDRDGTGISTTNALRRAVTNTEAAPEGTGGDVRSGDVFWHMPQTDVASRPEIGGTITDSGSVVWEILAVEEQTFTTRWRCQTRVIAFRAIYDTLVSIERARFSKGEHGETLSQWTMWKPSVRAKIQQIDAVPALEHDARIMRASHLILIEEDQSIGEGKRIIGPDGAIYNVLSTDDYGQVGRPQRVFAAKVPWEF